MPKIHTVTLSHGDNNVYLDTFASLDVDKLLKQLKKKAKTFEVLDDDEDSRWTDTKYQRAVGACKTVEDLVDLFSDVHAPFGEDDEPCMIYTVIKD